MWGTLISEWIIVSRIWKIFLMWRNRKYIDAKLSLHPVFHQDMKKGERGKAIGRLMMIHINPVYTVAWVRWCSASQIFTMSKHVWSDFGSNSFQAVISLLINLKMFRFFTKWCRQIKIIYYYRLQNNLIVYSPWTRITL